MRVRSRVLARALSVNGTKGLDPRAVARVVSRMLTSRRPRPRQVVGRDAKLGAFLVRVLPFRAIYALTAGRH